MLVRSFTRGSTHLPLIERTIGGFFDEMVERWPDREAVVSRHEGRRYTYRELQLESRGIKS
jgi:fatty-acyl-CoA synthase